MLDFAVFNTKIVKVGKLKLKTKTKKKSVDMDVKT